mmetsp:Transcript_24778/g.32371  ORF Transcript_24778/g.32371 Transcript_24778/m.32371 type:complete len:267 (-) Transcript_24778:287-1087(-)
MSLTSRNFSFGEVVALSLGVLALAQAPSLCSALSKAFGKSSNSKLTIGYWKIRGLAQPIRFLLEYTGTPYADQQYEQGEGPKFDRSCWLDVKPKMGMAFPNLPYLVDGNIRISQSNAILRYIARKHNLLGESEENCAYVDELLDVAMDFRNDIVRLCYNPNFGTLKENFFQNTLPTWVEKLSGKLDSNNWFTGDKITVVDFVLYELLDQSRIMQKRICNKEDLFNNYPNLAQFLDRFEELPAIKAYMKSERFMKGPINNKIAQFIQ